MAEPVTSPPMQVTVRGVTLPEAMTLLAVLRDHVMLEVTRGETSESYLFVRGLFVGTASALARLRVLLQERSPVEVLMVSHDSLAGLSGPTAMALVLDPQGTLGS